MATPEVTKKNAQAVLLLKNIKERLPELDKLLAASEDHWTLEDGVYRFYHQSFKVYDRLQPHIIEITNALQQLLPDQQLNDWFAEIVAANAREVFAGTQPQLD